MAGLPAEQEPSSPKPEPSASADPCAWNGKPRLVTGGRKGYYFEVGKALRDVVKSERGLEVTDDEETRGSDDNLGRLRTCRAEFALVQSDLAHRVWLNEPPYDKPEKDSVLLVRPLFTESVHILVRPHAGIYSLGDLKGRPVWMGAPESGSRFTARALMDAVGLADSVMDETIRDDIQLEEVIDHLYHGTVQAAFHTSVAPTGRIRGKMQSRHLQLLSLDWELVEKMARDGSYTGNVIREEDYSTLDHGVLTLAVQALLVVRAGYWASNPSVVETVAQTLEADRAHIEASLAESLRAQEKDDPSSLGLLAVRPTAKLLARIPEPLRAHLPSAPFWKDVLASGIAGLFLAGIYLALRQWVHAFREHSRRHLAFVRNHIQGITLLLANVSIWLVGAYVLYSREGSVNESFSSLRSAVGSTFLNILSAILPVGSRPAMTTAGREVIGVITWLSGTVFLTLTWPAWKRLLKYWKSATGP